MQSLAKRESVLHPTLVGELPSGQWWLFLGPRDGEGKALVAIADKLGVLRHSHSSYPHFPDSVEADDQLIFRENAVWRKVPARMHVRCTSLPLTALLSLCLTLTYRHTAPHCLNMRILPHTACHTHCRPTHCGVSRYAVRPEIKKMFGMVDAAIYFQAQRIKRNKLVLAPMQFRVAGASAPTLLLPYALPEDPLVSLVSELIQHVSQKGGQGTLTKKSRTRPHGKSFPNIPTSVFAAAVLDGRISVCGASAGFLQVTTPWEEITGDTDISEQSYPSTTKFQLGGNRKLKYNPVAKRCRLTCDAEKSKILTEEGHAEKEKSAEAHNKSAAAIIPMPLKQLGQL